jgi:hypothetical protein
MSSRATTTTGGSGAVLLASLAIAFAGCGATADGSPSGSADASRDGSAVDAGTDGPGASDGELDVTGDSADGGDASASSDSPADAESEPPADAAADANQNDSGPEHGAPPSCGTGLACAGGVDCCESPVVPGGTFPMGRSVGGSDACPPGLDICGGTNEQPEHPVTVSSFALDTFEVTVGRWRTFVNAYTGKPPAAGAGAHPLIGGSGWDPS